MPSVPKHNGFIRGTLAVIRTRALSPEARLVLLELLNYRDLGGPVIPKIATLARNLGISRNSVKRAVGQFRDSGLVTTKRRYRYNEYLVPEDFHRRLEKISTDGPHRAILMAPTEPSVEISSLLLESDSFESAAAIVSNGSSTLRKPPRATAAAYAKTQTQQSGRPVRLPPKRFSGGRDPESRAGAAVDFGFYALETVTIVRHSLEELAREVALAPPDEDMLRQILDAGRGADGAAIHKTLVTLFHQGKFKNMRSWGFLPPVLRSHFKNFTLK